MHLVIMQRYLRRPGKSARTVEMLIVLQDMELAGYLIDRLIADAGITDLGVLVR